MRQSSIYIQISGSDPKGVKASSQIFSLQEDGLTTSSASGILWDTDAEGVLLLAPATIFVPFLRQHCRLDLAASTMQSLSHNVRSAPTFLMQLVYLYISALLVSHRWVLGRRISHSSCLKATNTSELN